MLLVHIGASTFSSKQWYQYLCRKCFWFKVRLYIICMYNSMSQHGYLNVGWFTSIWTIFIVLRQIWEFFSPKEFEFGSYFWHTSWKCLYILLISFSKQYIMSLHWLRNPIGIKTITGDKVCLIFIVYENVGLTFWPNIIMMFLTSINVSMVQIVLIPLYPFL